MTCMIHYAYLLNWEYTAANIHMHFPTCWSMFLVSITLFLASLPTFHTSLVGSALKLIFEYTYQYNALWAMKERAQERCRRVTCTCHVGWKLPLEIPQSSTLKLESPYSSQDPKKRWSVQWRTCTDTPIALSKPHTYHIGLCSRSKFEHNQFSRSQYMYRSGVCTCSRA